MKQDPSSAAADAKDSRRWEGRVLGHGQREQGQAGLPQTIQIFTLVDPGAGFQQQSLSSGVKVAKEVEEKSKKTEATGKVMRGGEGQKNRWGEEESLRVQPAWGWGWERR